MGIRDFFNDNRMCLIEWAEKVGVCLQARVGKYLKFVKHSHDEHAGFELRCM